MYVDDFLGMSPRSFATADQSCLRETIIDVFGTGSLNFDKSILPCRSCDVIGWSVDLDKEIIFPNEKGRNKTAANFFGVDLTQSIATKTLQSLGSLATRYSASLRGMRPFVQIFFQLSSSAKLVRNTNSELKLCVEVWRAVALIGLYLTQLH